MSRLALYLLGPPRLELDGEPVHVERRKAMALLAYLAVAGPRRGTRSHSRDVLATLLWPEYDQRNARADLRRTLSVLGRTLGKEWFAAERETVGLNPEAELWLDVAVFRQRLEACEGHGHAATEACADCQALLEAAVELYGDDFMAGFSLPDSLAFEEWQRFESEGLRDELASALERLVGCHRAGGEYEPAIAYARRWLGLDPTHESAHRELMALYAQAGRRGAALRQYRACMRTLEGELGVPPAAETTALYERLRAERPRPVERKVAPPAPPPELPPRLPAFLDPQAERVQVPQEVFVARERELAQLDRHLEAALAGQGKVVFVTGGPGRGKTALMREFARRAMEAYPDLLAALGNCNAYSGVGDPYLPFRKALGMLTGDAVAPWAAGILTREQACRLWAALPLAVGALLERGTSLIDIFLPSGALLSRAEAAAPQGAGWLGRLKALVEGQKAEPGELAQSQLFEAYTGVLRTLAARHPLLLLLDDLQWADAGSVGLLFHLGRESADLGSRILILGAYRPEEVALGRDGERHPLEKALAEFKRRFGDVWLDLGQAEAAAGRRFVEAFLDSEPNRLGEGFRSALFAHAGGHPLFTIELLRAMRERGDLIRDEEGRWVEGPALDWETLPARVEGVIEERVGRLAEELRYVLTVASVEGEEFTAQVVARVGEIGERQLLRKLSQELGKRHRLVREGEELHVGLQRLSRYWFAHALFQGYLYNGLSGGERALLHREIAEVLEALYAPAGRTEEIVPQLARHYAEAGEGKKAIEYLSRAGDQAHRAYAHAEAIDHYSRALVFLKDRLPAPSREGGHAVVEQAARTLMKLGLTFHLASDYRRARQTYEEGFAMWRRAAQLLRREGAPPAPAPHALRVAGVDPTTLDPSLGLDTDATVVINQIFSGLVDSGPEGEIVPDVAQSWEILEGGRQYVFHLRDDVYWSDGVPVTAGDFQYAWKRTLDPATDSPIAGELYDIKGARAFHRGEGGREDVGMRALDDVTLTVELEAPTSYFLHLLASTSTYPVPRHVVEAHGAAWTEVENLVTNGPFRLQSWKRRESMVFTRNPAYHGRFPGNVERVELLLLGPPPDAAKALELYGADELDVIELRPETIDRARQRHAGEYVSKPALQISFVSLDVRRPPFDDPRVRRAFALAIDRERLADVALRGFHSPATGGDIPLGMPGHSPRIGLPYDSDRARRLLAEAGYPGGLGLPAIESLTAVPFLIVAEYLQAQWRENLGAEVAWEFPTWPTLVDRITRDPPHIFVVGWMSGLDPHDFLRTLMFQESRGWRNKAYAELLDQARRLTDHGERIKLYTQADRILIEEAAIIPLTYGRLHGLVKPWVSRFPISATGEVDFWKDVIIEPH